MLILIIEDDSQKASRIQALVEDSKPSAVIEVCRSYQSGLRRLSNSPEPDIVILDMSLPTFDPVPDQRQGRPRPLGGYELMRKAHRLGLHPTVVVLTALENFGSRHEQVTLEQLSDRCASEFPDMFTGAIHYSQSGTAWQTALMRSMEGR